MQHPWVNTFYQWWSILDEQTYSTFISVGYSYQLAEWRQLAWRKQITCHENFCLHEFGYVGCQVTYTYHLRTASYCISPRHLVNQNCAHHWNLDFYIYASCYDDIYNTLQSPGCQWCHRYPIAIPFKSLAETQQPFCYSYKEYLIDQHYFDYKIDRLSLILSCCLPVVMLTKNVELTLHVSMNVHSWGQEIEKGYCQKVFFLL